jgi:hypothetical protein
MNYLREFELMINPLVIPILGYLKKSNSSCSLIDVVNFCEQDLVSLIRKEEDYQVIIFQKNFFVMNALYQIQRDIQKEGFLLVIFPLEICIVPSTNSQKNKSSLTTRDTDLARYYLNWSNLNNITIEDINELFSSFWQKYNTTDKIDAALTSLGLTKNVNWLDIRQAYKNKITITHPDKGGCAEDFIEIRKAYEVLNVSYNKY